MTAHEISLYESTKNPLLAAARDAGKDTVSRLNIFGAWMHATKGDWLDPDLGAYRDYLLSTPTKRTGKPMQPASVAAHISTIRGAYQAMQEDNGTRRGLYAMIEDEAEKRGKVLSMADKKAAVDEALTRMENATNGRAGKVKVTQKQDVEDSAGRRLTARQAETLLNKPGLDTLKGVRDTAMIALMLCTGIREAELCALKVADLRQQLGGELALRVQHGKGDKQRLVPYGDLDWALALVEKWLALAGITEGPVFRGMFKSGRLRPAVKPLAVQAIGQMLDNYTITIDGVATKINPHDLRRTYARRLYEANTTILAIQQNLGHKSHATTERYIGKLDASARKPSNIYKFDLARLDRLTLV